MKLKRKNSQNGKKQLLNKKPPKHNISYWSEQNVEWWLKQKIGESKIQK